MEALETAITDDDPAAVREILRDADPSYADLSLALNMAIKQGNVEIARALLESGVKPRETIMLPGEIWECPIIVAFRNQNVELSELLLQFVTDRDRWLLETRNAVMTEYLLSKGADPNYQDDAGRTAFFCFWNNDYNRQLDVLISYGGDINRETNSGFTALAEAISEDSTRAVIALLEHGAKWSYTEEDEDRLIVSLPRFVYRLHEMLSEEQRLDLWPSHLKPPA